MPVRRNFSFVHTLHADDTSHILYASEIIFEGVLLNKVSSAICLC